MRPETIQAQPYPGLAPGTPVSRTTCGPRTAWVKNMPITATTPTISQVTPMLLIRDIQFTPMLLMIVVSTSSTDPSRTALAAPDEEVSDGSSPMIWNPLQTAGRTTCRAIAAAAAVTICARIMNQPANQPTTSPPIRRDHW